MFNRLKVFRRKKQPWKVVSIAGLRAWFKLFELFNLFKLFKGKKQRISQKGLADLGANAPGIQDLGDVVLDGVIGGGTTILPNDLEARAEFIRVFRNADKLSPDNLSSS